MHTLIATADAAFVRRLSGRLGRKHVSTGMPDEAGFAEIRVPDDFADRGMAAVRKLLAKQPWRNLSPDQRVLWVRRHPGFIVDVASQAQRTHQVVSRVWHGQSASRHIEAHLTAEYARLTETV